MSNVKNYENYLKIFFITCLLLNAMTIITHIISLVVIFSIFRELTGLLMLITFTLNFLLIIINFQIINRKEKKGKRIKNILWIYLVFIIIAILFIFLYHISLGLINKPVPTCILILYFIGIYGIFIFGILISELNLLNL
ncbi:MAG: hypothetical protein ACTSQO_13880 [Candidatus Helarchaeota archaeon]